MRKRSIIFLTVLMVVFGALTVLAEQYHQTITATIEGILEVQVPASLAWSLEVGANSSPEDNIVISSNRPWSMEISAANGGYFKKDAETLSEPLHLKIDDGEVQSLVNKVVLSSDEAGEKNYEVTFHQEVFIVDPAGDYEISIIYEISHGI